TPACREFGLYRKRALYLRNKNAPERARLFDPDSPESVHISPVFALQQIGEDEEEGQIQQHIDTHAMTGFLDRVGRIAEEGHQVTHSGIKLFFTLRTSTLNNRQHITLLFQHRLTGQRVAYD